MKKNITVEEILKIANLAHIQITNEEAERYAQQIGEILDYVSLLDEVDVKDAEFKSQTDLSNVFRDDETKPSIPQDKITQNRKTSSRGGYLVISSVLE